MALRSRRRPLIGKVGKAGKVGKVAAFLQALHRRPVEPRRPLSPSWAPLARALAGNRTAQVVAGPRTRAVLAEAGVPAATIGSTVYLPAPPQMGDPRQRDVVAHELTHVAAHSLRPRFHGGPLDRDEHRARRAGRAAAAMPPAALSLGSPGVMGLPVIGGGGVHQHTRPAEQNTLSTLQRATAAGGTHPVHDAGGSTSLSALSPSGSVAHHGGHNTAATPTTERPLFPLSLPVQRSTSTAMERPAGDAGNATVRSNEIDALLEALEDRVLADLERRGGRFAGEF